MSNEMDQIAARVTRNLQQADLDPSGNCFLVARALQILAGGGELAECRLLDNQHVIYQDAAGLWWDLTAHGCNGAEILEGVEQLPASYEDVVGYEWDESYSVEFAEDLVALVRP